MADARCDDDGDEEGESAEGTADNSNFKDRIDNLQKLLRGKKG